MIDWERMSKAEKAVRMTAALVMAANLAERTRNEDMLGAGVCGLAAVAALGLDAHDIRAVLQALESYGLKPLYQGGNRKDIQ